jgi:hypothetical protein
VAHFQIPQLIHDFGKQSIEYIGSPVRIMYIDKLASQIKNDVLSGLKGYHQNLGLNIEQLKDEVVNTRLLLIKEQYLKGVLPIKDLLIAINCVDVDCESLERCKCKESTDDTLVAHF